MGVFFFFNDTATTEIYTFSLHDALPILLCRWEVISNFLTQHLPESRRTAKEVLSQAKTLQKDDSIQRKYANESAFERTMKNVTSKGPPTSAAKMDDPSKRYMCELSSLQLYRCQFRR